MLFKRKKSRLPTPAHERTDVGAEPRSHIPLPADLLVDQDAALAGEVRMKHWLDEIYADFERSGGLEQLPGYKKPLVIPTGDVMNTLLKNAGVPHPWVLLRQTIMEAMEEALQLLERKPDHPQIDDKLSEINRQIVKMNGEAPSLTLHRRKVTRDNLREQLEKWR